MHVCLHACDVCVCECVHVCEAWFEMKGHEGNRRQVVGWCIIHVNVCVYFGMLQQWCEGYRVLIHHRGVECVCIKRWEPWMMIV